MTIKKNKIMLKYLIVPSMLILFGCSNETEHQPEAVTENTVQAPQPHQHQDENALQLNNGAKWKADDVTLKNVAALTTILNKEEYTNESNKDAFVTAFNQQLDTLVKECKMTGKDHDALHVWLEKVMHEVVHVKDGNNYTASYATLKKDVENFHNFFE